MLSPLSSTQNRDRNRRVLPWQAAPRVFAFLANAAFPASAPFLAGAAFLASALTAPGAAWAQQPGEQPYDQNAQTVFVQPEGVEPAAGEQELPPEYAPPADPGQYPDADPNAAATLIPPNVEGSPTEADGGGYCYVGPHPVDTRVVPGTAWDDTQGQHIRPYPPIDLRLFAYRDGCYYFVGDPRDFGYAGQYYSYYGAHPVLDAYGGGWCFMMGAHTHVWSPWSPYFTVVGPWYYWHGPYDPFFWAYWPYYSFYYRSYYPHYYAGGRFYRGGSYAVAPAIRHFPSPRWRGSARTAQTMRGTPPAQMLPPGAPGAAAPMGSPTRGTPYTPNSGNVSPSYRGMPSTPTTPTMMAPSQPLRSGPSMGAPVRSYAPPSAAPVRSYTAPSAAPSRTFVPAPRSSGGFSNHGSFHGGRR